MFTNYQKYVWNLIKTKKTLTTSVNLLFNFMIWVSFICKTFIQNLRNVFGNNN